MQQPLNGVTSYRAAKLWRRGNELQAGEGNQQKQEGVQPLFQDLPREDWWDTAEG